MKQRKIQSETMQRFDHCGRQTFKDVEIDENYNIT